VSVGRSSFVIPIRISTEYILKILPRQPFQHTPNFLTLLYVRAQQKHAREYWQTFSLKNWEFRKFVCTFISNQHWITSNV